MDNVIGGKLKLKKPLDGIKKKKSKKSKILKDEEGGASASSSHIPEKEDNDPRTTYEKKWDDQVKKLEQKNARSAAEKSHRDRVNEFNERLSKMSEHYDIPRVAGGG